MKKIIAKIKEWLSELHITIWDIEVYDNSLALTDRQRYWPIAHFYFFSKKQADKYVKYLQNDAKKRNHDNWYEYSIGGEPVFFFVFNEELDRINKETYGEDYD